MENSRFQYGYGIKSAIFISALFFSICILLISDSITWTTVIFSILLGIVSIWLPIIIPISFIIATVIIPDEILPALSATNELYGFGLVKLHPAGITLFIGSLSNVIMKRDILLDRIKGSRPLVITILLFVIFSISIFVQTLPLGGFRGVPQCLENYIFPFCFFLYLLTLNKQDMISILKYFIYFILLLAIYGLFEYWHGSNFLYDKLYLKSAPLWYSKNFMGSYRITTAIGHPLKNALYFLFSIPIGIFLFKKPYNIISAAILILAIFATGSRSAFFLSGLIIIACYTRLRFNIFEHYKSILIAVALALTFYLVLYHTTLGETLMRRFYTAGGSSLIRVHAMQNTMGIVKDNFLFGKGMSLSFESSSKLFGMTNIGFENPWLMLITDVGALTSLCYVAIIGLTLGSKMICMRSKGIPRGIYLSLIAFLLMASSFNSFGSRNTINFLLWFNIALLYAACREGVDGENRENL